MKNNKNILIGIAALVILLVVSFIGYYILNRQDKDTTLTLLEKQWIESNKNKVFDYGVLMNIPVFSEEGDGVIFDFFKDIEDTTKLSFNKTSYSLVSSLKTEYAFKIVDNKDSKDLLLYQDHYVLLTKEAVKYHKQSDIKDLVIGVLDDNLTSVNKYLKDGVNLSFKAYGNTDSLLASTEVDAYIVPRIKFLKEIMSSNNLNIAYNLVEMTEDYVLTLGDDARLNTIISKYFKKWFKESLNDSFNKHFTNNYFTFNEIDNKEKVKFRSKRYAYGFLDNIPYDSLSGDLIKGINSNILKGFANTADIEISYKKYSNIDSLVKDFNSNNLDFIYSINSDINYKMDVVNTIPTLENRVLIISPFNNDKFVNSLASLEEVEVAVIRDSKLADHLKSFNVKVKEFDNITNLLANKKDSLIAIDYYSYQYYSKDVLKKYVVSYEFFLDTPKTFALRELKANEVFNNYFNFYLTFMDEREVLSISYNELFEENNSGMLLGLLNMFGYVLFIGVISYETYLLVNRKKKKEPILSKSDKLKYVDMLTSLKNRNYLNDSIEKWDDSDVYPQSIVVVDLNNIAYINDNYGYQEGDKVIREAANILINSQMENSDIIRTSGNEFLVYLVGHEEKQIVSYIRRLNKEFKELSHDFGAAIGYSLILDGIKTIDDAINEATLDMRVNKEAAVEENGKN
jgi:diguanylate cyclase (GGDEF)-like protein